MSVLVVRVVSVLAALLLAAGGCSLVVGTDGLSGTAVDAPTDAGGTLDALVEATTQADAGDAGDGAVAKGCAAYADASFCQDFDDPTTALATSTWTDTDVGAAKGTITLVSAGAVSAPNAARLSLLDGTGGCRFEQLARRISGTFKTYSTRMTVRADTTGTFLAAVAAPSTMPGKSYRVLVSIFKPNATESILRALVQQHDSGTFSDFFSASLPFDAPPFGRDLDVTVEMTAAPNAKILVREGSRMLPLSAPADLAFIDPRVEIGPYCSGAAQTFTFDDVVMFTGP